MSTSPRLDECAALFGKTRGAVLAVLYGHADEAFYLRQVARAAGAGLGAVQRELRRLCEAGLVLRTAQGRHVYFQANAGCAIFAELKGLILKTAGLADVLRGALAPLAGEIRAAFVYGSMARGDAGPESDVDLMVVGDLDEMALHRAARDAEEGLGRTVNYTLLSRDEFRRRRGEKGGFLARVLQGPKLPILGNPDALR